jgi:SAM-dependent methyltransferase
MDTSRFAMLAQMRQYINDVRALPSVLDLKNDVQGLMGFMPEHDAMLQQQLDLVNRAESDFQNIQSCIGSMKQQIDAEYNEILEYLSTHDHFVKNLAISKNVREHWSLYASVMDQVTVEFSTIKDHWKYPAVCINAQHFELIDSMLGFDLLYMVDTDRTVLEKQFAAIDDGLSNRLKIHPVNDFEKLDFRNQTVAMPNGLKFGVPLAQMAMVVAPNIFERFPAETAQQVLEQIKTLLRPGGKIVFNVFDAETPSIAQLMSEGVCAGITQRQLNTIANELGLIVRLWQRVLANDFYVVVLSLPGELHSSKVKPSTGFRRRS